MDVIDDVVSVSSAYCYVISRHTESMICGRVSETVIALQCRCTFSAIPMVSQVQCWTTPPEQQGCSLYVPPKMPSLAIRHEFHAPISVTKLPAILGETAGAEDGA